MFGVMRTTWPLFLGLMFLMVGNGLQGTLWASSSPRTGRRR